MATTRHARWTQRGILFERGLPCANGKRTAPRERLRLSVATLIRTLNQRANWRELVGTPCGGPSHIRRPSGFWQLSIRLYERPLTLCAGALTAVWTPAGCPTSCCVWTAAGIYWASSDEPNGSGGAECRTNDAAGCGGHFADAVCPDELHGTP
jgi:hypothetical protein